MNLFCCRKVIILLLTNACLADFDYNSLRVKLGIMSDKKGGLADALSDRRSRFWKNN